MKKFYLSFAALTFMAAWFTFGQSASAQSEAIQSEAPLVSPNLVISQFQPGTTASANDEFIELHNIGPVAVDLNGYRVVYRSQNGVTDVGPMASWATSTVVQPGQFYLIASTSYTGTVTPNITYNNTTCACSLSATQGGLAIRLGGQDTGAVIDAVGWGPATNIFFEGTRTIAPGSGNSQARKQNGCQDTDDNLADFATLTPFAPRNGASTPVVCNGGGGNNLFAAIGADPSTVAPGSNTLLTVTVIPATTPPSTGITVSGNLSDIGGSANQTFFDDGTNGDATPGDNVFTFLAVVPLGTTAGNHSVTATAADAQARTVPLQQTITVTGVLPNDDPLLFGNPSGATPDVLNPNNYLMVKPQYTLSYNRSKETPNWTAWRLDTSWIGGTPRQDDFRGDTTLPAGWYQVQPSDYSEPIYDRGHMCPSGDRTNSVASNSATFLMTNMVPQLPANNQGPWADLENYCRTLATSGNEVYIISGPWGSNGTIGNGVVIPAVTWKVVLVLPNGSNDLSRVNRGTRVFGVIMSNISITQGAPWRNFRVTVDAVEALTGYNFFSAIPKNTQEIIERKRDKQ
ncbi:hypothetical protein BH10ACI3_BH10ACI3_29170 [soil metagenome]